MTMQAIILAGGLGTRLRPVVTDRPKAMADVGGRPFLEILLLQLKRHGVDRVTLAVGHASDAIRRHFGEGTAFGMKVLYSDDGPRLLGTGGALARAIQRLGSNGDDPILVMNGDTYLEYELASFVQPLDSPLVKLALAVVRVEDAARYGAVRLNGNHAVVGFDEKGTRSPGWVNAGVYCARRTSWSQVLPPSETFSLENDVLPHLVGRGLYALQCDGLFIDIGVPADYERAQTLLRSV